MELFLFLILFIGLRFLISVGMTIVLPICEQNMPRVLNNMFIIILRHQLVFCVSGLNPISYSIIRDFTSLTNLNPLFFFDLTKHSWRLLIKMSWEQANFLVCLFSFHQLFETIFKKLHFKPYI